MTRGAVFIPIISERYILGIGAQEEFKEACSIAHQTVERSNFFPIIPFFVDEGAKQKRDFEKIKLIPHPINASPKQFVDFLLAAKSKRILNYALSSNALGNVIVADDTLKFKDFSAEAALYKDGKISFDSPDWLARPFSDDGQVFDSQPFREEDDTNIEEFAMARDAMMDYDFLSSASINASLVSRQPEDITFLYNFASALNKLGSHRDALVVFRRLFHLATNSDEVGADRFSDADAQKYMYGYISQDTKTGYQLQIDELRFCLEGARNRKFREVHSYWIGAFRPKQFLANFLDYDQYEVGMLSLPNHREGENGDWSRGQLAGTAYMRGFGDELSGKIFTALRYYFVAYDLKPTHDRTQDALKRWPEVYKKVREALETVSRKPSKN